MADLGTLSTDARLSSVACGINEAGQIVGTSATGIATGDGWEMVVQHAFSSDGSGSLQDLGTLGGYQSLGFAIDELGRIVGRSSLAAASGLPWDEEQHAFVWAQGEMIDLGVLATERPSAAYAIDADGRIYGLASDADWNVHLVVWERADDGPGGASHSGLGDGSNPGHGDGFSHSPNQGTRNPHQR
jgi:probable HAF family extracellular repeat protein